MSFEQIRKQLDHMVEQRPLPIINQSHRGLDPLSRICRMMNFETWTQLCCLVVFLLFPVITPMMELPRAVYFIATFGIGMLTLAYLLRFNSFRFRNANHSNTSVALNRVVCDAKQTIECYESFCIAGCVLLPVSFFALLSGNVYFDEAIRPGFFSEVFLLRMPFWSIVLVFMIYALSCLISIWVTRFWSRRCYGKQIERIEETLFELEFDLTDNSHFSKEFVASSVTNDNHQLLTEHSRTILERTHMKKFDRWTSLVSYASFVAMFYVCILASPIAGSIIPFDSERQKAPNNLDFEVGKLGEFPANWTTTSRRPKSGLSDTQPLKGKKCFEVDGDYVYQTIEANTFRGKRIRFKAAVKVQKNKICQAQLLMDIGVDQAKSKRATPKSLAFYKYARSSH